MNTLKSMLMSRLQQLLESSIKYLLLCIYSILSILLSIGRLLYLEQDMTPTGDILILTGIIVFIMINAFYFKISLDLLLIYYGKPNKKIKYSEKLSQLIFVNRMAKAKHIEAIFHIFTQVIIILSIYYVPTLMYILVNK